METHGTARIARDRYTTQIEINGHRLISDESVQRGGQDLGPGPYDLVLAGLGACTAMTLRMYADRKEWQLDSVEVGLRLVHDADGALSIERTLKPVGLDAAQRKRLAEIAEKTPVTLTLKSGLPIHTTLAED